MKLARTAVVLAALAVLLYAAGVAFGLPPQAPVPPQAPPTPRQEFTCDCGTIHCHRHADGECHCGPRLRPGGRGVDCPLYEAKTPRPDGKGYCSPACSCGCNAGQPCDCGAARESATLVEVREILAARLAEKRRDAYQPAPVYYAPPGGCAGGSCGAAPARGLFRRR